MQNVLALLQDPNIPEAKKRELLDSIAAPQDPPSSIPATLRALGLDLGAGIAGGYAVDKLAPNLFNKVAAPDTAIGKHITPGMLRGIVGANGVGATTAIIGALLADKWKKQKTQQQPLYAEPLG
jgi:hypothetical protein